MELLVPLVPPALELIRSSQSVGTVVGRALQVANSTGHFDFNVTFDDGNKTLTPEELEQALEAKVMSVIIGAVAGGIIHIVIASCIACCYKSKVTDKRKSFPRPVDPSFGLKKDAFPVGLCDCCEDVPTCCFGWCCTPCRVGDTFTQAGVSSFWKMVTSYFLATTGAVVLQSCLQAEQTIQAREVLVNLLGGGDGPAEPDHLESSGLRSNLGVACHTVIWILYALLMAQERRKLRKKLGGKKSKFCNDCICYFFCFCCTVIQDARTVDQASDTQVACPCKLLRLDKLNAVGEPVSVSESDSDSNESD